VLPHPFAPVIFSYLFQNTNPAREMLCNHAIKVKTINCRTVKQMSCRTPMFVERCAATSSNMPENLPSKKRGNWDAAPEIRACIQANSTNEKEPGVNSDAPPLTAEKPLAIKEGLAHFEARFEPLRADFKKFLKAQNGFLAGLVFAEAKNARDAGNFTTAQEKLAELEHLLELARKREAETLRKAEKQFKDDFKTCERKVRSDHGPTRQSAVEHLKSARQLADNKDFIKANQELWRVKAILNPASNPPTARTNSDRNKPFTITEIP
jgi:hypothetical protein